MRSMVPAFDSGIIPAYAGNTTPKRFPVWRAWDHPRVCGEHLMRPMRLVGQGTSSPRMRGTPSIGSLSDPSNRDHPRVCGEHRSKPCSVRFVMGSSPRMRGTQCRLAMNNGPTGIIPAYAGNTIVSKCDKITERDHPRVCGEHADYPLHINVIAGSSPRMRGTHDRTSVWPMVYGIIPAYAGNTRVLQKRWNQAGDHPRVCGEHIPKLVDLLSSQGSSPRMRGTLVGRVMGDGPNGIIPAYAGNTLPWISAARGGRDHPRVCGEHARRLGFGRGVLGSSPRMRGTPTGYASGSTRCRIIPAYAGNTRHAVDVGQQCGDHPRVCGEHGFSSFAYSLYGGSSPRMRGTPCLSL